MRLFAVFALMALLLAGCSDKITTKDYLANDGELPAGFDRLSDEGMELVTDGWTSKNPGKVTLQPGDWPFANVAEPIEIWAAGWAGSSDGAEDGTYIAVFAMRFADSAAVDNLLDEIEVCEWIVALRDGKFLVGLTGGDLAGDQNLDPAVDAVAGKIALRTGAKALC